AENLTMKAIDISGHEIETVKLTKQGDTTKVKVNDQPEQKQTPVPPEKAIVPDEKIHNEPDDDIERRKVDPAPPAAPAKPAPPEQPRPTPLAARPPGS
ncbi:MAG: hypothetical protein ACREBE_08875, partial [bacterium]